MRPWDSLKPEQQDALDAVMATYAAMVESMDDAIGTLLSASLVLVMITGHLGGSLTHGSDYLTKPLKNIFSDDSDATTSAIKPIANVQEAVAYSDVVKPILETKCYSCHGANKQKGGLRMDDSLKLMKGGKDGKVITSIAPGKSINDPEALASIEKALAN